MSAMHRLSTSTSTQSRALRQRIATNHYPAFPISRAPCAGAFRPIVTLLRASPSSSPSSSSGGEGGASGSSGMTIEEAATVLGLSGALSSFDDILERKNSLMDAAKSDPARQAEIEQAYDILLMQSMRRRLKGDVSTSVRFADVSTPRKGASARGQSGAGSGPKLPSLGGGNLGVSLAVPKDQKVAAQQAAVFSALGLWALIQAVSESPSAQMMDTAGTQLTLALAYSVYTLRENKRLTWGKAIGLSFAGLVLWAVLGTAVQSWLRVDIVPLGNFQSPAVFCTEFVITGLMLGALFLA